MGNDNKAIVIGASAGGIDALNYILSAINTPFNAPIIIVQHFLDDGETSLAEVFSQHSKIPVKDIEEKTSIKNGTAYFAVPGYHSLIEHDKTFSLSKDDHVSYARPSIDVLFEDAAKVYGKNLVGIILTGANSDGTNGLKAIKQNGGIAIAQDPEEASTPFMPGHAIQSVDIDHIMTLKEIGEFLNNKININNKASNN